MTTPDNPFVFLSDSPLAANTAKTPSFGHKSIADSVARIIQKCPKPFTIGLFGKWGMGKTTIIHWLTNQLDRNHFAIAHIDAWKYEGDSLRRQFLITLDEELGLELDYKKVLNQSLSEVDPTKGKFKFDRGMFLNRIGVASLVIIFITLILKIIAANPQIPFLHNFSVSFDVLFNLGLAGYLIQLGLGFFQRVSVTLTEPRTDSAEGFDRRFMGEVLEHKKLKNKTSLLIIDNLDRCSDEKAVEMLSTIKTFLIKESGESGCVFLVACDDEAIRKHVIKLYADPDNKGDYNADEFLRKFFNTFIRIPRFIDTELQSYTEELLAETKVPELSVSEVAHVITSAFRENPRQIKQFINVLLAHFLLAKQRESEDQALIPKGTVTGHVPFLAKILVIQIRFPEIYEKILVGYLSFEEAERLEGKDYQNFIRATKAIPSAAIRAFLYFKQSEQERAIPEYDELRAALEENNVEIIQKRIEVIKGKPEQTASLGRLLPDIIEQNKSRRTVLLNIVSGSLEALHKVNLTLQGEYYNKVADIITEPHGELRDDLPKLEPRFIFSGILPKCIVTHRSSIVKKYVTLFTTLPKDEKSRLEPGFIASLFEQFLEHEEWLSDSTAQIQQAIVEQYVAHAEIMKFLANNELRLKKYFTEDGLGKFVGALTDANIDNSDILTEKTFILKGLQPVATAAIGKKLLQQYATLLNNEQQKPMRQQRIVFLNTMTETLQRYKGFIADVSNKSELSALSQRVALGMGAVNDWKQKRFYIPLCVLLFEIDQTSRPNLQSQIQSFFVSADLVSMRDALNALSEDERQKTFSQFNAQLNQRVQQDLNILKELYEIASPEIRSQWLINGIGSAHFGNILAFFEQRAYKVDDNRSILDAFLKRAKLLNPPEKTKMYDAGNNLDWSKCDEFKDIYLSHLKELLMQPGVPVQEAGFLALQGACQKLIFSATQKREIIGPCIDWLDGLMPAAAFQAIHVIRSVQLLWDTVKVKEREPVRNKFISFIFDKLISQGATTDSIKLGFEVLKNIDPAVTEETHKSYFEDVAARIVKEELNELIKKELEVGLNGLRSGQEKV